MARAIEDAVYLDEDAYNQMIPHAAVHSDYRGRPLHHALMQCCLPSDIGHTMAMSRCKVCCSAHQTSCFACNLEACTFWTGKQAVGLARWHRVC